MSPRKLFLFLLLPPLILLAPLLLGGQALFWGTPALQFIPWWKVAWDSVLSGDLPLWNPYVGMGAPLLANYQSALLYPPTWLYFGAYLVGGVPVMAWMQAVLVLLHLVWAALGMALLARALGLKPLAQGVSGLAFSMCGYLVARAWFASINATVAWLPWVLLFALRLVRGEGRPAFVRLTLAAALMLLAGHAQTSWYILLLTAVWSLYWSAILPTWRARTRVLAALSAALALSAMMAAPQLLPTAEYLLHSGRAEAVAYDFAMTYSLWPWRLLGLIAPGLFGSPVSGDFWGYGNYWEDALYLGVLPLLLALSALAAWVGGWRRKSQPWAEARVPASLPGFLLALMALAIVLALGKNTPVFPWLYRHVPGFDMFQAPTRWTIWVEFALALLAGLGAQRWRPPVGRALYWTRLATAGAFAVALGAGLALLAVGEIRQTMVRAVALAGLWGLGAGALALVMPDENARLRRAWEAAVLFLVAVDLLVAGWGLLPGTDLDFYRRASSQGEAVRAMLGEGRLYFPQEEEDALKYDHFLRFDTFHPDGVDWNTMRAALLPNLNALEAIPSVNNFDPLLPARYVRWMQALRQAGGTRREHMLDAMAVTVVEHRRSEEDGLVVFHPRERLPRAYWVGCAQFVAGGEEALAVVQREAWNPYAVVVLEGGPPSGARACAQDAVAAALLKDSATRQVWRVEAPAEGWLVVSDLWYPGWTAALDGQPVPLWRANYLFRAVRVPAGEHNISMTYRPPWLPVGTLLAGLAWFCFGISCCFWRTLRYNRIV